MGLAITVPQRLFAGLVAVLALTVVGDSWAKPKEPAPQDPVQCSAAYQQVQADMRKLTADPTETPAVKLARGVIPTASDPGVLETAAGACHEVASVKRTYRLPAYLCIGEASARMADLGLTPKQNHTDAYCAFQIAVELAQRTSKPDDVTRAHALEGEAVALMAMGRTPKFTTPAIAAYQEAIRIQPTAARHFALGRIYIALNQPQKAEREITAGAELEPSGPGTSLAFVALAELKRDGGAPPADVLGILKRAKQAAPGSIAANGSIGVAYFELNKTAEARQAFLDVIQSPMGVDAGGTPSRNYRAEAYYYLGVLDAREASGTADWQKVVDNAERAVQAGGGELRYRRLVCLAHIARGGDSVKTGASATWCEGQDTPEGQLLRGMYYLRRAQYVPRFTLRSPPSSNELIWREYLQKAELAFNAGSTALSSDGGTVALDWPGIRPATGLGTTLALGKDVVRRANMFCRTELPDNKMPRETALFDRYHVLGCKP